MCILTWSVEQRYGESRTLCQQDRDFALINEECLSLLRSKSTSVEERTMSVADFKKYGQMIEEDQNVRKRAKEIGMNDLDGQIAYAKGLGLEFTVDDMKALADEVGASADELSDEQLEQVAGGAVSITAALVTGFVAAAVSAAATSASLATESSRKW